MTPLVPACRTNWCLPTSSAWNSTAPCPTHRMTERNQVSAVVPPLLMFNNMCRQHVTAYDSVVTHVMNGVFMCLQPAARRSTSTETLIISFWSAQRTGRYTRCVSTEQQVKVLVFEDMKAATSSNTSANENIRLYLCSNTNLTAAFHFITVCLWLHYISEAILEAIYML